MQLSNSAAVKEEAVFKVSEIATAWKMSSDKVQQLFLDAYFAGEPGILVTMGAPGRWKINRRMLRVTESARFRMYTRLQTRGSENAYRGPNGIGTSA